MNSRPVQRDGFNVKRVPNSEDSAIWQKKVLSISFKLVVKQ